jgi:hypothetical protein
VAVLDASPLGSAKQGNEATAKNRAVVYFFGFIKKTPPDL